MMRKKSVMPLDSRYTTMIENAFYYCNPPEIAPVSIHSYFSSIMLCSYAFYCHYFVFYFFKLFSNEFYFRLLKLNGLPCMSTFENCSTEI